VEFYIVDNIFNILSKQNVLKTLVSGAQIKHVLVEQWEDIVGKLAKDTRVGHYRDGKLVILVNNPMWIGEMKFYETHIIKHANLCLEKFFSYKVKIKQLKIVFDEGFFEIKTEKKTIKQKISLQDRIISDNIEKRKKGMILCVDCSCVYVVSGRCNFCRIDAIKLRSSLKGVDLLGD